MSDDIKIGGAGAPAPITARKIDFTDPKQCGYFIFSILLFYMAVSSIVVLLTTFAINLLSLFALSTTGSLRFSDIRFAFSMQLFAGLEAFESLRYLLSIAVTSVLTLFLAFSISGVKTRYIAPSRRVDPIDGVCAVFFCTGAAYIGSVVAKLVVELGYLAGLRLNSTLLAMPDSLMATVFYFLALVILPALFEELLVRGLILSSLRSYGSIVAILLSSAIFALMHGSLPQVIQGLFFGAAAAYVVIKLDNIWLACAAHLIVNGSVFLSLVVLKIYGYAGYDRAELIFAILFAVLFVAAVAAAAFRHREALIEGLSVRTDRKDLRPLLGNPVAYCFYLVCLIQIVTRIGRSGLFL